MEQPNLTFLGKDRERLGEVSRLFSNAEDRAAFIKAVKDAADMKGSDQQKREFVLKTLLSAPKSRQYLKVAMPELYKEGLKAERGEGWKMSMKDIAKATSASEEELLDPKKGWMGSDVPMADLKFLLESEGLDYSDALKILQEAQTKKNRQDIWNNESTFNKLAMRATAPFTSAELEAGNPIDDVKKADYAGMVAGLVPWGGIFKAAGTVGRPLLDLAVPSVLEGTTAVLADDVDPLDAAEYSGASFAAGAGASGLLKNGLKGIKGLSGLLSKQGKSTANMSEDMLKEGFYRADLEKTIKTIEKKMAKRIQLTPEERELYKAYKFFGNTGADLTDLGKFSQSKLDDYLNSLKRDPLKATEKGRNTGKIGPGETVYTRREKIKASLDPDEQLDFDLNPGTIEFTDLAVKSDKPYAVFTQGWSKEAGFGPVTQKVQNATLQGHRGISGSGRPSIMSHIVAGRKAGLGRTDPYYPRSMDINEAVTQVLTKYPQLRSYFSKAYKDPETRDYLLNVIVPTILKHQVPVKIGSDEKEKK